MKHLVTRLVCLSALIVFFGSCKKDSSKGNDPISTSIIGTWELRKTSAAMSPGAKDYPPGNGNILTFTGTDYKAYVNGLLKDSGKYTITEDRTVEQNICLVIPDSQYTHRIVYDSISFYQKTFIQIFDGRLSFISGCYALDAGHTSEYARLEATPF